MGPSIMEPHFGLLPEMKTILYGDKRSTRKRIYTDGTREFGYGWRL